MNNRLVTLITAGSLAALSLSTPMAHGQFKPWSPAMPCEKRVAWILESLRGETDIEGNFFPTYDKNEKDANCVVDTLNGRWRIDPNLKGLYLKAYRDREGYNYSVERK